MKPNIILVLLDGARWDRLYKSDYFTSIQKEGFLLDNITAAYPYTFAAVNSIFTGLFGKENGVDAYYKMFKLKESVDYLPEILQKEGYFTSCDLISDKVISARGFDIYQSHDEYNDDLFSRHPDLIKKSFNNSEKKPFFTFLQFSKIHTATVTERLKKYEWDDPVFYKNKEKNLETYDNAFIESGRFAQKIMDTINELGVSDNTYVIFFADHGTGNGDRFGERNYGVFLYEETLRTFYLFVGPELEKNKVSSKLFSATQIFSTLLEISKSKRASGQESIVSYLMSGNSEFKGTEFTFSETGGLQGPFPSPKSPNVFCIKNTKFKLIYYETPNNFELFDLESDPHEKETISGRGLEIEQFLKDKLFEWKNR